MKIKFNGAAQEVTGSSHLLDFGDKKVLLDCGLFQGRRKEAFVKNREFTFDPAEVDSVILSHAHMDHSGNIPTLVNRGFNGNIFCTFATRDLCRVMLEDSAHIQQLDEWYYEKLKKKGIAFPFEVGPLYNFDHVDEALSRFMALDYHRNFYVNKYVEGMFFDAGHVLGSAMMHLNIDDHGNNIKLGFSGDLGRVGLPILNDPETMPDIDYLIVESTYGNREHDDIKNAHEELGKAVNRAVERGGKIIIPAFALERTQEIVYHLHLLWQEKAIPDLPIYVDSPLAVRVTDIFKMHPECYDRKIQEEFTRKQNPFGFENLKYITATEDSKALNRHPGSCIIISASGMCEAGRVRHHLSNNIEDPRNMVLTVGYMAENTLGRKIIEKESPLKLFDKMHDLKAEVVKINAFSGHADKHGLFKYVKDHSKNLKKVFMVHGELENQLVFAEKIKNELGIEVVIPKRGEEFELH